MYCEFVFYNRKYTRNNNYFQGLIMNKTQKEALLKYLEFHLISMVESVQNETSGIVQARLYNHSYDVLVDVEDALNTLIESEVYLKR